MALVGAVAVASLGLFFLALDRGWLGDDVGNGSGFCEAARDAMVRQPANTFSNLGFVTAGLLIAWHVERHWASLAHPVLMTAYAGLVVLLGPGSMAMHAAQSSLGGLLDLTSMYLVASFAAAYAVTRVLQLGTVVFGLLFLGAVALCEAVGSVDASVPMVDHPGNLIFGILLVVAVALEVVLRRGPTTPPDVRYAGLALGCMAVAFAIWNVSQTGMSWCHPSSLWQGHAAWHLLCAAAAYWLYRYYATEVREAVVRTPIRMQG
ncbi:hypothetical protein VV02_15060 [Luteipulveratus mongoliensis]|uniref:Ceramidase n=2 Tax=Luteipulveratus mongoliensis TaxID=571913 RepID=A0A0K1JJI0_9MICO|nr:hypothetical protein VV02_15060 [Luteipulveratus mongoliensis]